ncbi:MAG TPA: glycosyltransferase family 4 protein, partial [Polyangiales bacterium]|nr:glycosyltransferase family 4 protein [Polyangiales bacterium]
EALRICLLTYRGNPRSGGQGIYVRLLSQALRELGHDVDVWSGQPYPALVSGVRLTRLPSLDLWNDSALMRMPSLRELWDPINLSEWARSKTGGFVEPLTFSRRVARRFRNGSGRRYDIVHDNQCLGAGLLELQRRVPVVATVHHPITVDRRIAVQSTNDGIKRWGVRRWYSFLPEQLSVARKLDRIATVSEASMRDIAREYGVPLSKMRVVGNGINLDVFHPIPEIARDPDRLITTLSADAPLKGFRYLLDALHALRASRPRLNLTVIGRPGVETEIEGQIDRLGLRRAVHFTGFVEDREIARHYAASSLAVVPSLYEGFGFPAGEAMACEVAVVSTSAGALPEVVGEDGTCGVLVPPGDGHALARAIAALLDQPERRSAMGQAGRRRVLAHFTWRRAAERTVELYRDAIAARRNALEGRSVAPRVDPIGPSAQRAGLEDKSPSARSVGLEDKRAC